MRLSRCVLPPHVSIRKILYSYATRGEEQQRAESDPIRYAPASAPRRMRKREAKRVRRGEGARHRRATRRREEARAPGI